MVYREDKKKKSKKQQKNPHRTTTATNYYELEFDRNLYLSLTGKIGRLKDDFESILQNTLNYLMLEIVRSRLLDSKS